MESGMRRWQRVIPAGLLVLAIAVACAPLRTGARAAQTEDGQSQMKQVRGKLTKVFASGGETTGWLVGLDQEQELGGATVKQVEVDPRPNKIDLAPFADKSVEISGTLTTVSGVERGDRHVLVVQTIRQAGN
jgi:hypothetical protein